MDETLPSLVSFKAQFNFEVKNGIESPNALSSDEPSTSAPA